MNKVITLIDFIYWPNIMEDDTILIRKGTILSYRLFYGDYTLLSEEFGSLVLQ